MAKLQNNNDTKNLISQERAVIALAEQLQQLKVTGAGVAQLLISMKSEFDGSAKTLEQWVQLFDKINTRVGKNKLSQEEYITLLKKDKRELDKLYDDNLKHGENIKKFHVKTLQQLRELTDYSEDFEEDREDIEDFVEKLKIDLKKITISFKEHTDLTKLLSGNFDIIQTNLFDINKMSNSLFQNMNLPADILLDELNKIQSVLTNIKDNSTIEFHGKSYLPKEFYIKLPELFNEKLKEAQLESDKFVNSVKSNITKVWNTNILKDIGDITKKQFADLVKSSIETARKMQNNLDVDLDLNVSADMKSKSKEIISSEEIQKFDLLNEILDKTGKKELKYAILIAGKNKYNLDVYTESADVLARGAIILSKWEDKIKMTSRGAEELGGQIDTIIRNLIGYNLSNTLGIADLGSKIATEFQGRITTAMESVLQKGTGMFDALKVSFKGFGTSLKAFLLNPWVLAIAGLVILLKMLTSYEEKVTEISKQYGISKHHAHEMYKQMMAMTTNAKSYYVTEESINSVLQSHEERYGKLLDLSKKSVQEQVKFASTLGRNYGVAAGEVYDTMQIFQNLGESEEWSEKLTASLAATSEIDGISFKNIRKDLAESSAFIAKNFKSGGKELAKTVKKLHLMGSSLKQLSDMYDKLMDPVGWMSASAEISALTQGEISLQPILEMKWSGATEEEIAGSIAEQYDKMEKMYGNSPMWAPMSQMFANQLGTTVDQLEKGRIVREKLKDLTGEERDLILQNLDSFSKEELANKNLMKSKTTQLDSQEKMKNAWTSIKNELITALVPAMEGLSNIISMLVPVLKGIGKIFKVIGWLVQGILFPFNLIYDFILAIKGESTKFSHSIGGVAEHFKSGADAATKFEGVMKAIAAAAGLLWIALSPKSFFGFLNKFVPKSLKNLGSKITGVFGKEGIFGKLFNKGDADKVVESATGKKGIVGKIKDKISEFIGKKPESIDPATIEDKTKDISEDAKKMGDGKQTKNYLENLSDGLTSMSGVKVKKGAENLSVASKGFGAMVIGIRGAQKIQDKIDGTKLKLAMEGMASGLSAMSYVKVKKGVWNLIKASIGFIAMIPGVLGAKLIQNNINGEKLKSSLEGMASGLESIASKDVSKGSGNLILSSIGFIAMIPGVLGAWMIQKLIDGEKLQESLEGISGGLESMASGKVFLGSLALIAASIGFIAMIPGALGMLALAGAAPLAAAGLNVLGPALTAFGGVIMTGVGALGLLAFVGIAFALAYALKIAAPGLEKFKGILEGFSTVVEKFMGGIAKIIDSIGNSIGNLLKSITPSGVMALYSLGPALLSLAFGLSALGAGSIVSGIGAFFGGDPIKKIERLAAQADPMYKLADSLHQVTMSLKELSSLTITEIPIPEVSDQKLESIQKVEQKLESTTKPFSNVGTLSTINPSSIPIASAPTSNTTSVKTSISNSDQLQLMELKKIRQLLANNTNPEFKFEKKLIEGTFKAFKSNKGGFS